MELLYHVLPGSGMFGELGTVLALNHSCGPGHRGGGRDQQPVAHNQLFGGWAVPGGGVCW